jgi:DNA-binding MarR family transcriptional regulator
VSRSIEALVKRGLVTRTESEHDRRHKAVRATAEARELVDHLVDLRIAGIQDFVGTLSEKERTDLTEALRPIVAREEIAPMCITRKDSPTDA